ncbi:hypothetical protein V1527DRAFT_478953 [Lipomyces starkeyi]
MSTPSMSSSANQIDSEQKTLVETIKTILRLSDCLVTDQNQILRYGNYHTKVILLALALLDYGYNPESLARNLWMHLLNDVDNIEEVSQFLAPVGGSFQTVSRSFTRVSNLQGASPIRPLTWQDAANRFQQSINLMKTLLQWTLTFFRDLLIPMMAKGGTPTPSSVGTASRNQRDLKKKLLERDGWYSRVGYVMDFDAPAHITPLPGAAASVLEAAHIIPFSASKNQTLRRTLSIFAGQDMEVLLTGANINDPSNALLLASDTHRYYFGTLRFGLECRDKRYFIRRLVEDRVLNGDVLAHVDGEEILFGQESHENAKPSPLLCNVHLAVGLVLRNSGAAEMISKILQDEESFNDGNVDGDYWYQVSASYLDRELTALYVSYGR